MSVPKRPVNYLGNKARRAFARPAWTRCVRTHLGQEQFDRVYAHGNILSLEQALDVALAEHRLCAGCDLQRKYARTAPNGGSRAKAATSDRHAARLAFQGVSVRIAEFGPVAGWCGGSALRTERPFLCRRQLE
jgi:hypothetical protein